MEEYLDPVAARNRRPGFINAEKQKQTKPVGATGTERNNTMNAHAKKLTAHLAVAAAALMALAGTRGMADNSRQTTPGVLPPQSHAFGLSYGEWSAQWWKWAMELPVDGPIPHPFVDDPAYDVTFGQSGKVWFLAAPFGTVSRTCTIPVGKALCVGLLNVESSDLEGLGSTEAEQRANAKWQADHIKDVTCSVDGAAIQQIDRYRVESPQFSFTAPDPWLFSPAPGGAGTSVSDGYFVMIAPLSVGQHTIHYSGAFHFSTADGDPFDWDATLDMTYHLTVAP
jgi:hypothetical protein